MPRENSIPAILLFSMSLLAVGPTTMTSQSTPTAISAKARQLHFSSIVIDTHTDTTQRFMDGDFDLAVEQDDVLVHQGQA